MGLLEDARDNVATSVATFGRDYLGYRFPRDFEIYLVALELVTADGETIDYFIFPVNPNSITKSEEERTNVIKTLAGTTIINSDSYMPSTLNIKGNFGRSFKLLLRNSFGQQYSYFRGLSISNGVTSADDVDSTMVQKDLSFGPEVKTGFGCTKILQSIISKTKSHLNGKPFRLYFYNLPLGESYLVALTKNPLTLSQDVGTSNMIWEYNLSLKIIADLTKVVSSNRRSPISIIGQSLIEQSVQRTNTNLLKYVSRG